MINRSELETLSRTLVDSGKLIEAGWIGLRMAAFNATAPEIQGDEIRMAERPHVYFRLRLTAPQTPLWVVEIYLLQNASERRFPTSSQSSFAQFRKVNYQREKL
jgi:hypothetical protein